MMDSSGSKLPFKAPSFWTLNLSSILKGGKGGCLKLEGSGVMVDPEQNVCRGMHLIKGEIHMYLILTQDPLPRPRLDVSFFSLMGLDEGRMRS